MYGKTVTIINETGLHARPASVFVQRASKFQSDIRLVKNEREANAKSIISVLSLTARKGASLLIAAEGPDEVDAVETLAKLLSEFED